MCGGHPLVSAFLRPRPIETMFPTSRIHPLVSVRLSLPGWWLPPFNPMLDSLPYSATERTFLYSSGINHGVLKLHMKIVR
jgi:hypothetical protein